MYGGFALLPHSLLVLVNLIKDTRLAKSSFFPFSKRYNSKFCLERLLNRCRYQSFTVLTCVIEVTYMLSTIYHSKILKGLLE